MTTTTPSPDTQPRRNPSAPQAGSKTAIVIGGGIAGLASAALLARDGHAVTLLEANHELGGRAGTWQSDGFRFDTGPSWYLMPEVFDHFFRLLGTSADEQLDLVKLDPGYRVYFENAAEPIDIAADRDSNIDTFERVEPGAGDALDRYLDSAEDTYRTAVDRFLYTSFASFRPFLDRELLDRLGRLGTLLTKPLDRFVAGYVKDKKLQQILGYPAVFLGSSPDRTPAMYHLMSHLDMADGVLYPRGGFSTIIDSIAALARAEGVTIVTDARVSEILTEPSTGRRQPLTAGVRYANAAGEQTELTADLVVSCADLHHTETELVAPKLRTYPERWWRKRMSGPGAVLVMLGVRGELPELKHHTLFFTEDWKTNFDTIFGKRHSVPTPASFYACTPSSTDPSVAPAGDSNIFLLVPVPADPGLGHGGIDGTGSDVVEAIADRAIAQLAESTGVLDLADRIAVRRTVGPADFVDTLNSWKGGALGPAHTLRQSAFFRGSNKSKHIEGLYYAGGSTIPGIGLPMCLISAEIMLKRIHQDPSAAPLPEPL